MTISAKTLWQHPKFIRSVALTAGLLASVLSSTAPAAWPAVQPINMIIAYAPGGGTDIIARNIIPFIEKHLGDGARINAINRPGASGDKIGRAHV